MTLLIIISMFLQSTQMNNTETDTNTQSMNQIVLKGTVSMITWNKFHIFQYISVCITPIDF